MKTNNQNSENTGKNLNDTKNQTVENKNVFHDILPEK